MKDPLTATLRSEPGLEAAIALVIVFDSEAIVALEAAIALAEFETEQPMAVKRATL